MTIVPDNLKAAVTKSDRNEPIINEDFAGMAEFYEMAVFPARARRLKDKALVKNAVKLMYRPVYADIEGLTFNDLASLNEAIRTALIDYLLSGNASNVIRRCWVRYLTTLFSCRHLQPTTPTSTPHP